MDVGCTNLILPKLPPTSVFDSDYAPRYPSFIYLVDPHFELLVQHLITPTNRYSHSYIYNHNHNHNNSHGYICITKRTVDINE